MKTGHGAAFACALALTAAAPAANAPMRAVDCPEWLQQAARIQLTAAETTQPAVVLLDDLAATVSASGVVTNRRTYAARIHNHEGQDAASIRELYLTDTGKVRQLRGWIIRPSGEVQELDKKRVLDLALAPNDVYNEARVRLLSAGEVEPGTVFGAEVVSEDRSIFGQTEWTLQDRWAVRVVARSLTVPPGWQVSSVTFNHPAIQPVVNGTTYAWAVRDLPAIENEPSSLPDSSVAPRVAINYAPASPSANTVSFGDWKSVSTWLAKLNDGQAQADPAMTARAKELTAGAATGVERIAAVGAYVKKVQYISIQIGMGRGGGYKARPAAVVFARNHGDCKDKANLMRAMLAAIGIRSHLVAVFYGDRGYVREQWPSPAQFNHCILAVVLDGTTAVPGPVVDVPGLGRLLIVDPTAEFTPVGEIPGREQGSLALVMASESGALIRLPDAVGERANGYDRTIDGSVTAEGAFDARVRLQATGDVGSRERAAAAGLTAVEYERFFERRMASDIQGAKVTNIDSKQGVGVFEVTMRVAASRYAQAMQSRLLIVRPPFRATERIPALNAATRKGPVDVEGLAITETLRLDLPSGFVVDELPQATSITTPFGSYSLAARAENGRVLVERRCEMKRAVVPASDYSALRAFLDKARSADSSPIVLQRQ